MRLRTRTIVTKQATQPNLQNVSTTFYSCNAPPAPLTTSSGASVFDIGVIEETMSDEIGKNTAHYVKHRRRTLAASGDCPGPLIHQNSTAGHLETPLLSPRWPAYHRSYTNGAISAWDVNDVQNLNAAPAKWTIVQPDSAMESVLKENVLRSARGLKADILLDIIQASMLWPAIKDLIHYLPAMAANWKRARTLVKTSSNAYLAWKFGIGPVISDVMKVNRYLSKMGDDIRRHVNGDRSRYSQLAMLQTTTDETPRIETIYGQTYVTINPSFRVLKAPQVRYVLVVEPNGDITDPTLKGIDRVLSRFATSPATLAWELIPFSFVSDWFLDVRGALRAIDDMLGFNPYKIISFTRSFSYELQTAVNYTVHNTCSGSVVKSLYGGTVEFKHYERRVVSSDPSWIVWKPRYGENQAGITAALIGQRLKKR